MGKARQEELAELREYWSESHYDERLEKLREEDHAAYQELIEIDPENGEAWYDDDKNVPVFGSRRDRIKLVRARIDELKQEAGDE